MKSLVCLPGYSFYLKRVFPAGCTSLSFFLPGFNSSAVKQGGAQFPRPSAAHPILGDVVRRSLSHSSLFHISFLGRKSCQDLSMQV